MGHTLGRRSRRQTLHPIALASLVDTAAQRIAHEKAPRQAERRDDQKEQQRQRQQPDHPAQDIRQLPAQPSRRMQQPRPHNDTSRIAPETPSAHQRTRPPRSRGAHAATAKAPAIPIPAGRSDSLRSSVRSNCSCRLGFAKALSHYFSAPSPGRNGTPARTHSAISVLALTSGVRVRRRDPETGFRPVAAQAAEQVDGPNPARCQVILDLPLLVFERIYAVDLVQFRQDRHQQARSILAGDRRQPAQRLLGRFQAGTAVAIERGVIVPPAGAQAGYAQRAIEARQAKATR